MHGPPMPPLCVGLYKMVLRILGSLGASSYAIFNRCPLQHAQYVIIKVPTTLSCAIGQYNST